MSPTVRHGCWTAALVLGLAGCGGDAPDAATSSGAPGEVVPVKTTPPAAGPKYTDSAVCAECHEREFERWTGSHHDLAMQEVSEATVLGDFADAALEHDGVTTRFFRRDGRFMVRTEGAAGRPEDFEIAYVFGVTPLQQYLIAFPGGRLQCLTVAWDTVDQRWFDLYPDDDFAADDGMHWTGCHQSWNSMCAECHSTNLRKAYDPATESYETTWHEIDVGCQSCHGPGDAHVRWARDYDAGLTDTEDRALLVDYSGNDARYQVDTCARCHSRRHRVTPEDEPGDSFLDGFMPEMLREGLYHADGQILEEVYVYGSFVQSRMYHQGVRCTDCHDAHSVGLLASPDALCLRCHQEYPPEEFPNLQWLLYRKRYDTPEHHFHEPDTSGASCVECHMPARRYMVVDPRRDHGFRVPRPDLTVELGVPNACNDCHDDRDAKWAADQVDEWYGTRRREEPHFADEIADGRAGDPEALARLVALAADVEQPGIVRGTALLLLRRYGLPAATALLAGVRDDDPMVRAVAAGGLEILPPAQRALVAAPLLRDPVAAVRFEAARVMSSVPPELVNPSSRSSRSAAIDVFRDTQLAESDLPAGRLNVGLLHANQGRPDRAEQSYRTALRMDPAFLPASFNLANLLSVQARPDEAVAVLRDAMTWSPGEGELHYSLGLSLAETGRLDEALPELGRAAELLPVRPRVHYNRGLALQHLGQIGEAEASLLVACELAPSEPDFIYALVILYAQQQRFDEALTHAERLLKLAPDDENVRAFVESIRRQGSGE